MKAEIDDRRVELDLRCDEEAKLTTRGFMDCKTHRMKLIADAAAGAVIGFDHAGGPPRGQIIVTAGPDGPFQTRAHRWLLGQRTNDPAPILIRHKSSDRRILRSAP